MLQRSVRLIRARENLTHGLKCVELLMPVATRSTVDAGAGRGWRRNRLRHRRSASPLARAARAVGGLVSRNLRARCVRGPAQPGGRREPVIETGQHRISACRASPRTSPSLTLIPRRHNSACS